MLTVINRRFTRWIMNQVNHKAIQHEWFMTYIVYAMNVQAHERKKETLLQGKHRRYRLSRVVFSVFFCFVYHQHSVQCAAVQEQYRNKTLCRM